MRRGISSGLVLAFRFAAVAILNALAAWILTSAPVSAGSLPTVHITGIVPNADSVKVLFDRVPGAKDYRIYCPDDPTETKYAGIIHLHAGDQFASFDVDADGNPILPLKVVSSWPKPGAHQVLSIANDEIEWNGLKVHHPTRLVVEAVDALGPTSSSCLPNSSNGFKFAPDMSMPDMVMLGSNAGLTADGRVSINGQGDWNTKPNVIARSPVFTVTVDGKPALPSRPDAEQVAFDQFDHGTVGKIAIDSMSDGNGRATMHSALDWELIYRGADVVHSRPFIMNRHFMDILFDGNVPGHGPMHIAHGSMAMSPLRTADISGGRILHVTMEIDSHLDARRWFGFNLVPADDPLTGFYPILSSVNKSNHAVFCDFTTTTVATTVMRGSQPGHPDLPLQDIETGVYPPKPGVNAVMPTNPFTGYQIGRGLDDRSRFDMFTSTTHFSLYMDGVKIADKDWAKPLPFDKVKVYYTHYVYHTANAQNELPLYAPYEVYWLRKYPFSDERHWDNMGFEVLPASTAWTTFDRIAALPAAIQPTFETAQAASGR